MPGWLGGSACDVHEEVGKGWSPVCSSASREVLKALSNPFHSLPLFQGQVVSLQLLSPLCPLIPTAAEPERQAESGQNFSVLPHSPAHGLPS